MIDVLIRRQLKGKKRLAKMTRLRPPKDMEREYERKLVHFLQAMYSFVQARVISQVPRWSKNYEMNRPANLRNDADDPSDEILRAMEEVKVALSRQYTDTEIRRLAEQQGLTIAQFNEKILKNGFQRVLGFDIFFAQPYLRTELNMFASLNSKPITAMRDETMNKVEKVS